MSAADPSTRQAPAVPAAALPGPDGDVPAPRETAAAFEAPPVDPRAASPWLTVIGIGDGGLATLAPEARAALERADTVFGGQRHLAMLDGARETVAWRSPFRQSLADIAARRGRRVAILATGDPAWFGVAATLADTYSPEEMRILPSPSAFSLAAARLGWPLQAVETLSVHGLPLASLHRHVLPAARLLVLSDNAGSPAEIAGLLNARGYGPSRVTVLEHLGGPKERIRQQTAASFAFGDVAALNIVAVDCIPGADAALLPPVPGLPDDAFRHDGKMTKRVPRAVALAALAPFPSALLWDVGAGCGSVAVEWMRAARRTRAVAFEPLEARRAMIADNATALGAPGIAIVGGKAPAAFDGVSGAPDAVFIGGGLSDDVFAPAFARLKPGGRLVAHAVTLESERLLIDLHARHGGELLRLSVDRAEPVGPFRGWRPSMPVVHWAVTKPAASDAAPTPDTPPPNGVAPASADGGGGGALNPPVLPT